MAVATANSRPKKVKKAAQVDELDLVIVDGKDAFVRQAIHAWALEQFRQDKPCAISPSHATNLRRRAENLYDALLADLED